MSYSVIVRKIGNSYGLFKFPAIQPLGMAEDTDQLLDVLKQINFGRKSEMPANDINRIKFPYTGASYYFITMPDPLSVSINKGIITEKIMETLKDSDKRGNVFETYEEARKVAKKIVDLFE